MTNEKLSDSIEVETWFAYYEPKIRLELRAQSGVN